eukprot:9008222-Pyramimonas_sp.AAC.1
MSKFVWVGRRGNGGSQPRKFCKRTELLLTDEAAEAGGKVTCLLVRQILSCHRAFYSLNQPDA